MAATEALIAIAIVGCAHIHTPQFAQRSKYREDFQVKAVWDVDPVRAAKWRDFQSTATTDLHRSGTTRRSRRS